MVRHLLKALPLVLPLVLALMALTAAAVLAATGTTDSPGVPTTAGSQMYTLEQLYDLLTTGITSPKMTTFTEPGSGPGTGTMHTLDDIMAAALANRCNCASGTLYGTRWCINSDGTVTDLTSCLVWAQDLSSFGQLPLAYCPPPPWAHALFYASKYISIQDNFRLPTLYELSDLTSGPEGISSSNPGPFTGVQADIYWSTTHGFFDPDIAYTIDLTDGHTYQGNSCNDQFYFWPVRNWD